MSLPDLFTTPYSLIRVTVDTEPDPDTGDDVTSATPVAPRDARCYFEQRSSSETNIDRTQEVTTAFAMFKAGTALSASDLVVINDERWSIVGRPNRVLRRGVEHHVECQLQLVT